MFPLELEIAQLDPAGPAPLACSRFQPPKALHSPSLLRRGQIAGSMARSSISLLCASSMPLFLAQAPIIQLLLR